MQAVPRTILLLAYLALADGLGPGPIAPLTSQPCSVEGEFTADTGNMCWYHQCIRNAAHSLQWMPRRCAWMTAVDQNYVQARTNPCTVNLNSILVVGNPCVRKSAAVAGEPPCHPTTCLNGGTPLWEGSLCWCECPPTWRGNHDCSMPTRDTSDLPPGSDICVDSQPQSDWCAEVGGCLNGGTCFNQCDSFWCDCGELAAMSADHIEKRCEIYTP